MTDPSPPSFEALPFEEQLRLIAGASADELGAWLPSAARLADGEPLVRIAREAFSGPEEPPGELVARLSERADHLGDPTLQALLTAPGTEAFDRWRIRWAEGALRRWGLERASAMAFVVGWLRRRDPQAHQALLRRAVEETAKEPAEERRRWLFFVSGKRLVALHEDPRWAPIVQQAVAQIIETLASAPKSLSQANAEALLARRVYADPGHFFFELLQNADDAGAHHFKTHVDERRVLVGHDGDPFSLRDLVGILSIGQTTKRAEQIGFFGVGFKSVYEVTSRPRVSSGVLDFEIAHVSVPRRIAAAPERRAEATELVLPFDPSLPVDPVMLYRRASALPGETLLTLRGVRSLEMRGPRGERSDRSLEEREVDGDVQAVTLHEHRSSGAAKTETQRAFLTLKRTFRAALPREEGRAAESPVLVAFALSEGEPAPLEGPTLFAFLPTQQHTGLRFLVHARFDVTLDRERLELESPWNEALLREAGRVAGELVAVRGAVPFEVLPCASDLAPVARPVLSGLREALAPVPVLEAASGRFVSPNAGRLASRELAGVLAGVDVGSDDAGAPAEVLAASSPRERDVLLSLGVRPFSATELLGLLERTLGTLEPTGTQRDDRIPAWLEAPEGYAALMRALADLPVSGELDARLRRLPLLRSGAAWVAPDRAVSASDATARLYEGLTSPVAPPGGAEDGVSDDGVFVVPFAAFEELPSALRGRIEVGELGDRRLIEDLRNAASLAERGPLLARPALLDVLAEGSDAALQALEELPLLPGASGGFVAARNGSSRAAFLASGLERLAEPLGALVPLVAPSFVATYGALASRWLTRLDVDALAAMAPQLAPTMADAVLDTLDELAPSLSARHAEAFLRAPLFLDRRGCRRPIIGPGRALVPAEADLLDLLPGWPWLLDPQRPFLRASPLPKVEVADVVGRLTEEERAGTALTAALLDWLAARAQDLSGRLASSLLRAEVWLDEEENAAGLHELRRAPVAADPGAALAESFFERSGLRRVAHPSSLALVVALGADERLPETSSVAIARDLIRLGEAPGVERSLLAAILTDAAAMLPVRDLRALRERPLFLDEDGRLRAVSAPDGHDPQACLRPGVFRAVLRHGRAPLLDEEEEGLFSTFLDAAQIAPVSVNDLVRLADGDDELLEEPERFRSALLQHAAGLDGEAKGLLEELTFVSDREGLARSVSELAVGSQVEAALGAGSASLLGLDDALLEEKHEELVVKLGLHPLPLRVLLQERVFERLAVGAPLREQPPPFGGDEAQGRRRLVGFAHLVAEAGLSLSDAPVSLVAEASGPSLATGAVADASDATRTLAEGLGLPLRLADEAWAALVHEQLPDAQREALLAPVAPRHVAEALRAAYPSEASREGHPLAPILPALYRWLRESREQIAMDAAARGALGAAAVLPSQRGTLRAPRELVLDPSMPDLGLDWGLASEVPGDVAAWLARTYELDRHQRRSLLEHLLDGLDAAAEADDVGEHARLLRFLASALGFADETLGSSELESRVRHTKVRARLRVPVVAPLIGSGERGSVPPPRTWDRPRKSWLASSADAARVASFARTPPPIIRLPHIDDPTRDLLVACGAQTTLDDGVVIACLDGEERVEGAGADRALARFVVDRLVEEPSVRDRWKLGRRRWLPDTEGRLRRASELLYPDELAVAMFGEGEGRFPHPEIVSDLPESAVALLGLRRAEDVTLKEVAGSLTGREASDALLDWLEEGLVEKRLRAPEVRAALRDTLRWRDDVGRVRPVTELAVTGSRELFGDFRGDLRSSDAHPKLIAALGIPLEPDVPMILTFLAEATAGEWARSERSRLVRVLPRCFEALGDAVQAGRDVSLPENTVVAGVRAGAFVLSSAADPSVRLFEPESLAASLPDKALERFVDPLPRSGERDPALSRLLLSAKVPDLWAGFEPRTVAPGPPRDELRPAAEALRRDLAKVLGDLVGEEVRVAESLVVEGAFGAPFLTSDGDYRSSPHVEAEASVPAALVGDVLWMTPEAVEDPSLLAPAFAREPERRVALERWLADGEWSSLPRRLRGAIETPSEGVRVDHGFLGKLRNLFRGDGAKKPPAPKPSGDAVETERRKAARADARRKVRARDDQLFAPQSEIGSQLEGEPGWVEARRVKPAFGFAFSPARLAPPWLYAPKTVGLSFDRRGQRWRPVSLERPQPVERAGVVRFRGELPAGDAVLPVPLYGTVLQLLVADAPARTAPTLDGGLSVHLDAPAKVELDVALGEVPPLATARPASMTSRLRGALASFVPTNELPGEALELVAELSSDDAPALERALAVRDFIRERYRYDASYLEDPTVGQWLARVTRGREAAHIAALHAARDGDYLGAGVCYELNALACELLRRVGIPAAVASGWVLDGGALSEPDHLWALAFLEGERGQPVWLPIDASTTRQGRPLRVPRRPPGRFRPPARSPGRTPSAPDRRLEARSSRRGRSKPKRQSAPRGELLRLLTYLERRTGEPVSDEQRRALEGALEDPEQQRELLRRLQGHER